jgi:ATP-dependent helicase HepA
LNSTYVSVGALVDRSPAGIGRVGAVDGNRVKIEYFESVAEPAVEPEWVPLPACRRARLGAQTRVFYLNPDTGAWRAGRIVGGQPPTYFVRFPNTNVDIPVAEADLRVRWDRPVRNPVDVLAISANESPYFRDARLPLLKNFIAQRSACGGMTALLSSAIEIHPHQVHAAMTVLSDPIQRYLLADEVGLGKTIEAGIIIRQTFLDDPTSRVALLSPDVLRRQWQAELQQKFFVDDFPKKTLRISSHETPEKWREYHGFDLLVVDEAHRLVQIEEPNQPPYRELAALARSVPNILLLSATPATARSITRLGLLHLLDPEIYRWENETAFNERLDARKALADAMYALDADLEFLLRPTIEQLEAQLPDDSLLHERATAVLDFLTEDGSLADHNDRPALARAVEALRAHIGETYRLHRRMIRHRRSQVLTDNGETIPYEVRGRARPRELAMQSAEHDAAQEALLAWQAAVADWLLDHDAAGDLPAYARILAILTSRAGGPVDDLADTLRWRLQGDEEAAERAGLTTVERDLLRRPAVLSPEKTALSVLDEARSAQGLTELASAVARIARAATRSVVFCGPGSLATGLSRALRPRLPRGMAVGEHTSMVDPATCAQAVRRWAEGGSVLVVDGTAEDGLNLQLADVVVHCRLPTSPNQVEQRLGRVDRYVSPLPGSPTKPVPQFVLTGAAGEFSMSQGWRSLLVDGYGIFDESLSALQEAVESGLDEVWRVGLEHGPSGLTSCAPSIEEQLKVARREVEAADLLDSVYGSTLETADISSATIRLEDDWKSIERAVVGYAGMDSGGLRLHARQIDGERVLRFELGRDDPLLPPRMFALPGMVFDQEHREGAFNRSVALRRPGTRVFRCGHPFFDLLSTIMAIDDRGQASALWRRDPKHTDDPEVYFGLDLLVEASFRSAAELVGRSTPAVQRALRRQGDRLLGPFVRRIWVPALADSALDNANKIVWLDRRYSPQRGDTNLNASRISMLFELFGGHARFAEAASKAADVARSDLNRVTDLAERTVKATERGRIQLAILEAQARARQAAGGLVGDRDSHLLDAALTKAFIADLADPEVTIVSATCVVRGGPERLPDGD